MPLSIGSRLGPYEILSSLGAGGMGEVYRARDTQLGRDVAIKVLTDRLAGDPDRLVRFEREARTLAALNHPNIAQIYGLEAVATTPPGRALVMELVEGEDLSQRISRGALTVGESLAVAKQIAAALDAAHERGIVHRDLKPANIKLEPDGTAKVLDFGLAKSIAPDAQTAAAAGADSPTTLSPAMTEIGMILGTAAYMAPEQARGKPVDKRADIWAFGCVWFEMLAGTRAFSGDDVAETIGAVIHKDPNWPALPPTAPPHLRRTLERCLEKDPKRRLRDIGDVSWDQESSIVAPAPIRRSGRIVWLSSAAFAFLAAAGWWQAESTKAPATAEMILTIGPTAATLSTPVASLVGSPLISPDGSAVLFVDHEGFSVRRLDSLDVTHVPGSEHATNTPFWSADSSTVFYAGSAGSLVRVRMPDGAPENVITLNGPTRSGSVSDAGTVMVASSDLLVKRPTDAAAWPAILAGTADFEIRYPEFLPGGEDFVCFLSRSDDPGPGIYLATLQGRSVANLSLLVSTQTAGHYTSAGGGRLLFVKNDNLYAQTLDRATRRLDGEPALVVAGVASLPGGSISSAEFSVASNGTVVWRPGRAALSQVTVFDRHGTQIATAGTLSLATSVEMSPDGQRVIADGDPDELLDVGQPTGLALPRVLHWSNWSLDGTRLVGFDDSGGVVERSVNGASDAREIGRIPDGLGLIQDLSLDGAHVVALQGTVRYASVTGAADARTPHELADAGEHVRSVRFSPDAHWVVYADPPAGIFVQAFPGPGRRQRIAPKGSHPVWRADGREIVYIVGDSIWSVPVSGAGPLAFGAPGRLFGGVRFSPATTATARPLTLSRDGSRIAVPQAVEQPESVGFNVLLGSAAVVGRR